MKKKNLILIFLILFSVIMSPRNVFASAPSVPEYDLNNYMVLSQYSECSSTENVGAFSGSNGVTLYVKKVPEPDFWNFVRKTTSHNTITCKTTRGVTTSIKIKIKSNATVFDPAGLNGNNQNVSSNGEEAPSENENSEKCYGILGDLKDDGKTYDPDGNKIPSTGYVLIKILRFMKIIGPIITIIFTVLDAVKTVTSGDKDALPKFGKTTVKRLIYAILLFIFPTIVDFIIKIAFAGGTCGIN